MQFLLFSVLAFFGWRLITPQQAADAVNQAEGSIDTGIADGIVSAMTGVPYTPIPSEEPSILTSPVPTYNDGESSTGDFS